MAAELIDAEGYLNDAWSQDFDEDDLADEEVEEKRPAAHAARKLAASNLKRAKRWAFTVQLGPNRDKEGETATAIQAYAHSRGMGGFMTPEQASTGTWHLQGALICKRSLLMEEIQYFKGKPTPFKGVHMETQKCSWDTNVKYCTKTDMPTYKFGDVDQLVEEMEKGKIGEQGKRTDIQKIIAKLKDGATKQDLLNDDEVCGTAFRSYRWLDNIKEELEKRPTQDVYPWMLPNGRMMTRPEPGESKHKKRHIFLWGPANVRKTGWLAQFRDKDVFFPAKNRGLEGYEGQEMVIFDMWMPDWYTIEHLCDTHDNDIKLPARYKDTKIPRDQERDVIITSNNEPNLMAMTEQEKKGFAERFQVIHATKPLPVPAIKKFRVVSDDLYKMD